MPRKVIIDCDTGMDDAVALLLALRSLELNVVGITCVNGNVGLDRVTVNTLKVVEHSDIDVPVFAGARSPLMHSRSRDAAEVHGRDGLGGIPFPEPKKKIENKHAVDFIIETFMASDEPMDWITLGPMTNTALALRKEPHIMEKVRLLIMMAGGVQSGNTTPVAEFNVFADPEAAKIVFDSDLEKMMVPLDPLWNGGHLTAKQVCDVQTASEKPWCAMAGKIFTRTQELILELGRKPFLETGAVSPPDLLAVAVAINPSIAKTEDFHVFVETGGEYSRGMTIVDNRQYGRACDVPGRKKVSIALTVDQSRYADLVLDTWLER